jgi:arylsulfatase A
MCAPARAALLTGRYNHRTGALDVPSNRGLDRIALRERTVADAFKAAGYATGMVGKWHNGAFDMRHHPNARGFEEFVGFLNGGMGYWKWVLDVNGQPRRGDGTYLTDVFTDEAVGFIERHRAEPFFLYVAYNAPHQPLEAPEEDVRPFREMEKFSKTVCTLYGMLRRMDAGVGRILDALEQHGLREDTIVLFTSDNGPWLRGSFQRYNGPFRGMKGQVLEGGIRVPAIVRWPAGLPANQECGAMVHFCDWLPTLMAAARIEREGDLPLDGANVLPALRGESGETPTTRCWQWNRYQPVRHCNAAMRDGHWKLVWPAIPEALRKLQVDNRWYRRMYSEPHFETEIQPPTIERTLSKPRPPKLFNLKADPHEDRNLAKAEPERLAKMIRAYDQWFESVERDRRAGQSDR